MKAPGKTDKNQTEKEDILPNEELSREENIIEDEDDYSDDEDDDED